MKFGRITPLIAASVLVIAALGIAGCGSNSVGPSGNSISQVKSFNALQGCAQNIDIEQVSVAQKTASNLAYGAVPFGYTSIRAGIGLHYGIFPAGQTSNALWLGDIDLNPHDPNGNLNSGTYTLTATGICGVGAGTTKPTLVRLIDAFPFTFTGANTGTVALRVVNLVPDLTGGITLASNGAALHGSDDAGTNNELYATTSSFDGSHYNTGINLAGSPTLTIRTNANAILGTVQNFTFAPNHAFTIFVIGEVNPTNGGQAITVVPIVDF